MITLTVSDRLACQHTTVVTDVLGAVTRLMQTGGGAKFRRDRGGADGRGQVRCVRQPAPGRGSGRRTAAASSKGKTVGFDMLNFSAASATSADVGVLLATAGTSRSDG